MIVPKLKTDSAVKQVLDLLAEEYGAFHPKAKIEAYRFSPGSVRLRIIDPDFAKLGWDARIELIWKILEDNLPETILRQLWFACFLTPKEAKTSATSMEFDDPLPEGDD